MDRGGKVSSETRMRWDSTPHHKNHGQYEVITRILLTNEPRSYREAIAAGIRLLRPNVEVIVLDPDGLDAGVQRHEPDLVVCSRATDRVRHDVHAWIELYPESGTRSMVNVGGEEWTFEDIQLSDLLSVVDRVDDA